MHILGLVLILLLGAAIFGPQLWVRHVLQRHGADRPDFPGTGSELAEHLIAEHGLDGSARGIIRLTSPDRDAEVPGLDKRRPVVIKAGELS